MIHIGETRKRTGDPKMDDFSRAAVSLLERGDILSHYLTWEPGGLILKDGTIYPELIDARKRGVLLDSCHGLNHFSFAIARHALERGMIPDVVSTDLATMSRAGGAVARGCDVQIPQYGGRPRPGHKNGDHQPGQGAWRRRKTGQPEAGDDCGHHHHEVGEGQFYFQRRDGRGEDHGEVLLEPTGVFKEGRLYPAFSGYHIPPVYA